MGQDDTQADRVIQGIKNNRVMALAIAAGVIVIGLSTFTDAAKNLYGMVAKQGPEEAREQLSRISLKFTPQDFIDRAKAGDEAAVKLFMAAGMSPDASDDEEDDAGTERHRTAMMYAAGNDNTAIVEALIKAGADINKMDNDETALSWAAAWGSIKTIHILLDHGANAQSIEGALLVAGPSGREDVVRLLLPKVADIKKTATAVLLSTVESTIVEVSATEEHIKQIAAFLLDQGADANARSGDAWTTLTLTVDHERPSLIPVLLAGGADIDAKCGCSGWNGGGWDALMMAIEISHADMVETLIGKGANVNLTNNAGETALMLATEGGNLELVRTLLARGASVGAKTVSGQTALQLARKLASQNQRVEIMSLLEKAGAK